MISREHIPYEICETCVKDVDENCKQYLKDFVLVGPKNYLIPAKYAEEADIFYNFEFRRNDVLIVGFPRCGTTLGQELIWLLCNDLNFEEASKRLIAHRVPYLERSITLNERHHKEISNIKLLNGSSSAEVKNLTSIPSWQLLNNKSQLERRCIKSHLPLSLLPPTLLKTGCKVLYLSRNPKDVSVSYYHLNNLFKREGYNVSFKQHWDLFQKGLVPFAPYIEHSKEAWKLRKEGNLLFIFYEELNKNFKPTVTKICEFLDKDLTEIDLNLLQEHFKIENFRENKMVNNDYLLKAGILNPNAEFNFIRKGETGDWKNYFDKELQNVADEWIRTSTDGTGDIKRISSTKYSCPARLERYADELFNFEPRKDDIWLVGYPRCGTTLMQEILYLLGTDLNYNKAAATIMDERFPYLEHVLLRSEEDEILYQKLLQERKSSYTADEEKVIPYHVKLMETNEKRFIKSHLGFDFIHPNLLEVGCKVVFITRNIKDCLVSEYFYPIEIKEGRNVDDDMYNMFRFYSKNLSHFGNYFALLQAAWKRRHNNNLLFLFYEEVIADKRAAVLKIADFLGKKLTEKQLDHFLNHIEVKNFKNNKSLNNDHLVDAGVYVKTEKFSFIRQGKSGGWREHFKKEMNDEFDEWIRSNFKEIPEFEVPMCWKQAMDLE